MSHNEERLISRIILTQDILPVTTRGITSDWFLIEENREVFRWITEFVGEYGKVPTASALKANFPSYTLRKVEDPLEYLADAMVTYRRRLLTVDGFNEAAELLKGGDTDVAINRLHQILVALENQTGSTVNDLDLTATANERFGWYEEMKSRPGGLLGYPTGFPTIDKATSGLQGGQLVVVLADAKAGKSTISMQIAANIHRHPSKPRILFMTYEMNRYEQQQRHDAMRARISHSRLRHGTLTADEEAAYKKMLAEMEAMDNPLLISDSSQGTTVSHLAARVEETQADVVVVDGVYLMLDEITGESNTPQALTNLTRSLKRLAQKLDVPLLISTQALAWKMSKHKLTAGAAGYSSSFVQDADVMLGIERAGDDIDDVRILKVLASRNCGQVEVMLRWDWDNGIFMEEQ